MNTTSNTNTDTPSVFTYPLYTQLAQPSLVSHLLMPQSRLRSKARSFVVSTFTQLESDFLDINVQNIAQTPGHWHKHYVQFEIDGVMQATGKSEKVTDPFWVETFSLCVSHFLHQILELNRHQAMPCRHPFSHAGFTGHLVGLAVLSSIIVIKS